jgi:hypothetical protein
MITSGYSHFSHDHKYMDVARINLLHKIWCNIQKNDHMMATYKLVGIGKLYLHSCDASKEEV